MALAIFAKRNSKRRRCGAFAGLQRAGQTGKGAAGAARGMAFKATARSLGAAASVVAPPPLLLALSASTVSLARGLDLVRFASRRLYGGYAARNRRSAPIRDVEALENNALSRPWARYTRRMLQSQEILEAALQLPQEQREVLVDKLAASLELGDLGEYWEGEIQRRIRDVDAGRVATIPADEVFARLEQRFGGK